MRTRRCSITVIILVIFATTVGAGPFLPTQSVGAAPAWLDYFNSYRASANLPTLTEDASLSAKDVLHAQYVDFVLRLALRHF